MPFYLLRCKSAALHCSLLILASWFFSSFARVLVFNGGNWQSLQSGSTGSPAPPEWRRGGLLCIPAECGQCGGDTRRWDITQRKLEKGISPARGAVSSALGKNKMSSSGLLVCSLIVTCQRTPELQVQHLFSSHAGVGSQWSHMKECGDTVANITLPANSSSMTDFSNVLVTTVETCPWSITQTYRCCLMVSQVLLGTRMKTHCQTLCWCPRYCLRVEIVTRTLGKCETREKSVRRDKEITTVFGQQRFWGCLL